LKVWRWWPAEKRLPNASWTAHAVIKDICEREEIDVDEALERAYAWGQAAENDNARLDNRPPRAITQPYTRTLKAYYESRKPLSKRRIMIRLPFALEIVRVLNKHGEVQYAKELLTLIRRITGKEPRENQGKSS
jgi:hypothetical protein